MRYGSHFKGEAREQNKASSDFRYVVAETRDGRDHDDSPTAPLATVAHWACNTDEFLYQFLCAVSEKSDNLDIEGHVDTQHVARLLILPSSYPKRTTSTLVQQGEIQFTVEVRFNFKKTKKILCQIY